MSRPDGMSGLSYRMTMALSRDMFASNSWRCEAEAASGPKASAGLIRITVLAGIPVGGYSARRVMLKATIRSEEPHVRNSVTNAHLVCRTLHDKKHNITAII